jgi:ribosomal protein S18 acetylase RimI-like enzyme
MVNVRRASEADHHAIANLFDAYRQFYGQTADLPLAEAFIRDRLINGDSVIFLAIDSLPDVAVGFAQLYPSFSSVAARRIWILNDLFVVPEVRRTGVGRALLDVVQKHAISTEAKRIVLSTAVANREARALYEADGYQQETVFVAYKLEL